MMGLADDLRFRTLLGLIKTEVEVVETLDRSNVAPLYET